MAKARYKESEDKRVSTSKRVDQKGITQGR